MALDTPDPAPEALAARGALTGKAALITGAARRVGASIARTLHAAGADVVLHYRSSADDADALMHELNDSRPGSAALAECDLLEVAQLPALVAAATGVFGGLDILVNNASTFYPTPLGDIGEIDWDDLVGTNLKAPLFLAQAAAPLSGVQPRQGGTHHADQIPGARARAARARECGGARTGHVAGRRAGQGAAGENHQPHGAEGSRLGRGRGARLPVLRHRGPVRHGPDSRGGWRPQHRLVT